jgi:hypothetical protein
MYQLIDVNLLLLPEWVLFAPVLRRPGRQRWTRVWFLCPSDAMAYGRRVSNRFARWYGDKSGDAG